jgi:histidinol-phosphate/aromatic aminotransferase/cobyric acid decarboxylase-like protein
MVDESMQIWHSNKFQLDSLISQSEWIENLYKTRKIAVYIMHSWTKIWSCTGIRLGSVLCPTAELASELKKLQVPWSVNVAALRFLEVVCSEEEEEYLNKTWELTPKWRASEIEKLRELEKSLTGESGNWKLDGEDFLSWIWIDFLDEVTAEDAAEKARQAGVPVRPGKNGYKEYTKVRIAVRSPEKVDILINAWKDLKRSQ